MWEHTRTNTQYARVIGANSIPSIIRLLLCAQQRGAARGGSSGRGATAGPPNSRGGGAGVGSAGGRGSKDSVAMFQSVSVALGAQATSSGSRSGSPSPSHSPSLSPSSSTASLSLVLPSSRRMASTSVLPQLGPAAPARPNSSMARGTSVFSSGPTPTYSSSSSSAWSSTTTPKRVGHEAEGSSPSRKFSSEPELSVYKFSSKPTTASTQASPGEARTTKAPQQASKQQARQQSTYALSPSLSTCSHSE